MTWVPGILIDTRNMSDKLYQEAFEKIDLKDIANESHNIVDSNRRMNNTNTVMVEFVVVDCPRHFNVIMGRLFLFKTGVIISMYHLSMKCFVNLEVGKVTGDQVATRRCSA